MPKRITCNECGAEYDEGAPHAAFCRGTKETKCGLCGETPAEDEEQVILCQSCGEAFCVNCGDPEEKLCDGCL